MKGVNKQKSPFPWFGGKQHAAPHIWAALGDPAHYVEPFAGSLATLLLRPHQANRTYFSETVNDLDGMLVNAWRAITYSPDETAEHASWPVSEADLHARHITLVLWRDQGGLDRLVSDPQWHDPKMAGWWLWGQSSWIGSGWCAGTGPWTLGADGILYKQGRGKSREPGVDRQLPHLGSNGQGVNRPQLREPGVDRRLPNLGDNGRGVNHAGLREPGVGDAPDFHAMTMPELREWFRFLSARLRHVRILNGDWTRAVTSGATKTISVRQKNPDKVCGVFLDPPYLGSVRTKRLYSHDDHDVAHAVRAWCIANGPDPDYRIVLAGFDEEHAELSADHGWTEIEWFKAGFLRGGMGNIGKAGHNQKRERLWLSPHCLTGQTATDGGDLFRVSA